MQRLRTCAAWRPDTIGFRDPVVATKLALKYLARRILDLNDEIAELDRFIVPLVEELAPNLLELEGVGSENAGAMMVAVGDNPERKELTQTEAAARLNTSARTMNRLIRSGVVPARQVCKGAPWVISADALALPQVAVALVAEGFPSASDAGQETLEF